MSSCAYLFFFTYKHQTRPRPEKPSHYLSTISWTSVNIWGGFSITVEVTHQVFTILKETWIVKRVRRSEEQCTWPVTWLKGSVSARDYLFVDNYDNIEHLGVIYTSGVAIKLQTRTFLVSYYWASHAVALRELVLPPPHWKRLRGKLVSYMIKNS